MTAEKPRGRGLSARSMAWIGVTFLFALMGGLSLLKPGDPLEGPALLWSGFDLEGHRGARGLAPENSLPGFEAALAIGVTTLELDVVSSAEGTLLVHHDRRLDPERTRDAEGRWLDPQAEPPAIIALPAAGLAGYDIGRLRPDSRAAGRFPGQRGLDGVAIPSLAEVLARAEALSGGRIRYNVETKISPLEPETSAEPATMAKALVEALRAAGVIGRVAVQSFDWRSLEAVREIAPEIPLVCLSAERPGFDTVERGRTGASPWLAGLDVDALGASLPRAVAELGCAVWSPSYRDLRQATLDEAHRLGLKVVVWTVDEPADMASLIERGVDGIITDYPDRLREVMAEAGLPLPPAFPAAAQAE